MLCSYDDLCYIIYALSCVADIVQSSINAAIQIKPLLLLLRYMLYADTAQFNILNHLDMDRPRERPPTTEKQKLNLPKPHEPTGQH